MELLKEIKTLQNEITDIFNDIDTNIKHAFEMIEKLN